MNLVNQVISQELHQCIQGMLISKEYCWGFHFLSSKKYLFSRGSGFLVAPGSSRHSGRTEQEKKSRFLIKKISRMLSVMLSFDKGVSKKQISLSVRKSLPSSLFLLRKQKSVSCHTSTAQWVFDNFSLFPCFSTL